MIENTEDLQIQNCSQYTHNIQEGRSGAVGSESVSQEFEPP